MSSNEILTEAENFTKLLSYYLAIPINSTSDLITQDDFYWTLLGISYNRYHHTGKSKEYKDEFEYSHMLLSYENIAEVAVSVFGIENTPMNIFKNYNNTDFNKSDFLDYTYLGEDSIAGIKIVNSLYENPYYKVTVEIVNNEDTGEWNAVDNVLTYYLEFTNSSSFRPVKIECV